MVINLLKGLLKKRKKKKTQKLKVKKSVKKKGSAKKVKKKIVKKIIKRLAKTKLKKRPAKIIRKIKAKEKEIGKITHYYGKISVGIIKLKGPLKVGDKIHIKGAHDDFTQRVTSIQFNHKDITTAQKGKEIGIKVTQRVHENDIVYLSK